MHVCVTDNEIIVWYVRSYINSYGIARAATYIHNMIMHITYVPIAINYLLFTKMLQI